MMKGTFLLLLFVLLFSAGVLGQEMTLEDVFSVLERFNFITAYQDHSLVIDSILYLFFFISAAQFGARKAFKEGGREVKVLTVVVGIVFGIAAGTWEFNSGFRLGNISYLALALAAAIILIQSYRMIKGSDKLGAGTWIAVVAIIIGISIAFPQLFDKLKETAFGNLGITFLTIIFLIALIYGTIKTINSMQGRGSS